MRTKLIESNKPERYIHSVRNADTSAAGLTIPVGSPLVLNLSATPQPPIYSNGLPAGYEDGLQVVLPSTAGAVNSTLYYYGVAAGPILFQQYGESVAYGVCQVAVVRATRASSNASWASQASVGGLNGLALTIDTVNNAFGTATMGTEVNNYTICPVIMLDNFATMAGSASNVTDTRVAVTQLYRAFVRQM